MKTLTLSSADKIPLSKLIWGEYHGSDILTKEQASYVFPYLQELASKGELAIIIDGLDELGTMILY